MKITSRKLKLLGACRPQIALFKELGGDTKKITRALCLKHASQFNWTWAAQHLLSPPACAEYERVRAPAWVEYERVQAPAWAEYKRVQAPAWAEYERMQASAWAEYKRVEAPAWAEYKRVQAPALAEYERVEAITFFRMFNKEQGKQ